MNTQRRVKVKTPEQIRAAFDAAGITVSTWARRYHYRPKMVHEVLAGRIKGKHGVGHEIAVRLGLKAGVLPSKRARS